MYEEENVILCGASAYTQKFYLNPDFDNLPETIQEELKVMCVLYTEDIGGTVSVRFAEDGEVYMESECEEGDLLYDDIGSILKIKQLQREKTELFEALEMYYRLFVLNIWEEE